MKETLSDKLISGFPKESVDFEQEIKIEAISQVQKLKTCALNHKMKGNNDDAIICADQAIRIAIQYDLGYDIKEFEMFSSKMFNEFRNNFFWKLFWTVYIISSSDDNW